MYDFDYQRPASVADASKILLANPDAKIIAGGMTLIPTLKLRLAKPSILVDLGAIQDLVGVRAWGGSVMIGAMTTHGAVASSPELRKAIPGLAHLAGEIGDPAVRNRGTIGGSVSNNDPAADYPAALLGLGAVVQTNVRALPADEFFQGMFETALKPGEIVQGINFPVAAKTAYMKFANPASRYAMVGVFVSTGPQGVRVAVTGAAPSVFRWTEAEAALSKTWTVAAVENLKYKADGLNSDIHGSAEYRAHLVGVMTKRAVQATL